MYITRRIHINDFNKTVKNLEKIGASFQKTYKCTDYEYIYNDNLLKIRTFSKQDGARVSQYKNKYTFLYDFETFSEALKLVKDKYKFHRKIKSEGWEFNYKDCLVCVEDNNIEIVSRNSNDVNELLDFLNRA